MRPLVGVVDAVLEVFCEFWCADDLQDREADRGVGSWIDALTLLGHLMGLLGTFDRKRTSGGDL
ncbi:MAG: hypothetical protein M3376_00585 [Actinomycetota bacterium]|nr:hypothetical protein [Actinomycetota bacterium]